MVTVVNGEGGYTLVKFAVKVCNIFLSITMHLLDFSLKALNLVLHVSHLVWVGNRLFELAIILYKRRVGVKLYA